MSQVEYSIQDLSDRSGLPRRTIHFYTQQGLLPPPSGAGLGARYDEGHLLRLQLIILLRGSGLRLDEIRKRLAGLPMAELQQLHQELVGDIAPLQYASTAGTADTSPAAVCSPVREANPPAPATWLPAAALQYTHYILRPGWTLAVPSGISPLDQRRLDALLEAAGHILSSAPDSNKE